MQFQNIKISISAVSNIKILPEEISKFHYSSINRFLRQVQRGWVFLRRPQERVWEGFLGQPSKKGVPVYSGGILPWTKFDKFSHILKHDDLLHSRQNVD